MYTELKAKVCLRQGAEPILLTMYLTPKLYTILFQHRQVIYMKKINFTMLGFALLATVSIMAIGIAVSSRSIIAFILSILFFILAMGLGFIAKKKLREKGDL